MHCLLAVHGYPPELIGGTEHAVRSIARNLAAAGHDVTVVAGSLDWPSGFGVREDEDRDPESGAAYSVLRLQRDDLYFDHWQKARNARVREAFRGILRDRRPDVAHVHHWLRLTDDLVTTAAEESIPAVVTLHDLWTTCLVTHRIQPGALVPCEAPLGPDPCVACAARIPPRTPWLTDAQAAERLDERSRDLARELALARVVFCLSEAQARTIRRFFPGRLDAIVTLPPARRPLAHERPVARIPPPAQLGRLVLGAWGSIDALKGTDLVLDAVARLDRDGIPVELHLAGRDVDPSYAARLREASRGLNVTFHGTFADDALVDHPVTRVHAVVSGTRAEETWGLVVDEAIALGLPLVLPRSGAFPERVRAEGDGTRFYAARSVDDLARVLARLWNERDLVQRLSAELPSVERIAPTPAAHMARCLAAYETAIARGAPDVPPRGAEEDGISAWDAALRRTSPRALGFEPDE